jgi:hypothetical protein
MLYSDFKKNSGNLEGFFEKENIQETKKSTHLILKHENRIHQLLIVDDILISATYYAAEISRCEKGFILQSKSGNLGLLSGLDFHNQVLSCIALDYNNRSTTEKISLTNHAHFFEFAFSDFSISYSKDFHNPELQSVSYSLLLDGNSNTRLIKVDSKNKSKLIIKGGTNSFEIITFTAITAASN